MYYDSVVAFSGPQDILSCPSVPYMSFYSCVLFPKGDYFISLILGFVLSRKITHFIEFLIRNSFLVFLFPGLLPKRNPFLVLFLG